LDTNARIAVAGADVQMLVNILQNTKSENGVNKNVGGLVKMH